MSNSAQQSIDINVSVDKFYGLITDFENYSSFLNDVKAARILTRQDEVWEVEFTIHLIRQLNYVLRLEGTPNKALSWSFVSGQMFKTNNGGWLLEDRGDTTRATYTVDVGLTRFVPKAISSRVTQISLPIMLNQWKDHAETLYPGENP